MTNAESARAWLARRARATQGASRKHFVALSTNSRRSRAFGIDTANMFEFWDWVGGRYSLWSAIGLPIALRDRHGQFRASCSPARTRWTSTSARRRFAEEHAGAHGRCSASGTRTSSAPRRTRSCPTTSTSTASPAYLQQGDMESNGKSVDREGQRITTTRPGPIIWGEPGTNGQHAFYQLIHQGTRLVPCDFIAPIEHAQPARRSPRHAARELLRADRGADAGQDRGRGARRARGAESCPKSAIEALAPHKTFPGNRPTNTFLIDKLTPASLGRAGRAVRAQGVRAGHRSGTSTASTSGAWSSASSSPERS